MNVMKKTLMALTLGTLMATGTALAAGPVSDVATATADIVFAASGTATAQITPVSGLLSGEVAGNTKLADSLFTASAGDVAYRWTPGTYTTSATGTAAVQHVTVTGKAGNKLSLFNVRNIGGNATWDATGWWVPDTVGTRTLGASILKSGSSNVAPDTYPVSMDAVVWQR